MNRAQCRTCGRVFGYHPHIHGAHKITCCGTPLEEGPVIVPQIKPRAAPRVYKPRVWPWYWRIVKLLGISKDKGIGDTLHRLLSFIFLDKLVTKMIKNCGCIERRQLLNSKYRYNSTIK